MGLESGFFWELLTRSSVGSRSLLRNFWWREESGEESLGVLEGEEEVGEVRLELRRRLEGEKVTVAVILGGGVGGFGSNGDSDGEVEGEGSLGLGAKKREITCCFCFPMEGVAPPHRRGVEPWSIGFDSFGGGGSKGVLCCIG